MLTKNCLSDPIDQIIGLFDSFSGISLRGWGMSAQMCSGCSLRSERDINETSTRGVDVPILNLRALNYGRIHFINS